MLTFAIKTPTHSAAEVVGIAISFPHVFQVSIMVRRLCDYKVSRPEFPYCNLAVLCTWRLMPVSLSWKRDLSSVALSTEDSC